MELEFEIVGNELILHYSPIQNYEYAMDKINSGDHYTIKHTFHVTKELIRHYDDRDFFDETISFRIGIVSNDFIEIDKEVIKTEQRFFFSKSIKLKMNMFVASRDISILSKIDQIIDSDFYVMADYDGCKKGIPKEEYIKLINTFPKTAELNHYTHSRIANIIKEWFPESDKYQLIYDRFIEKKEKNNSALDSCQSSYNIAIEIAQFSTAKEELSKMLSNSDGYTEKMWQEKIQNVIQLLYPQYILSLREIRFKGIDKNDKQPDFILVDTNGYVDILEIKKPEIQLITRQASYRNNYVPVRDFSGTIQQIEKYLYCLTSIPESQKIVIDKIRPLIPKDLEPEIVSPKGILIIGRSNNFNKQQKNDFELIKRQYKNIADIMTYDDLLKRIDNILFSLKAKNKN